MNARLMTTLLAMGLMSSPVSAQTKTLKLEPAEIHIDRMQSKRQYTTSPRPTPFRMPSVPILLGEATIPIHFQMVETEWHRLPLKLEFERERVTSWDPREFQYQPGKFSLRLMLPGNWRFAPRFRAPSNRRPGMFELTFKKRF